MCYNPLEISVSTFQIKHFIKSQMTTVRCMFGPLYVIVEFRFTCLVLVVFIFLKDDLLKTKKSIFGLKHFVLLYLVYAHFFGRHKCLASVSGQPTLLRGQRNAAEVSTESTILQR